MPDSLHCPKCNSTQLTAQKHGFSAGKAAAGAILTGGIGLLAGLHGSSKIDLTCLACGHTWNPKKLAEHTQKEDFQNRVQERKTWERNFYRAYEKGEFAKAEQIYLTKAKFHPHTPDVHAAYKFHKKIDRQNTLFFCVFIVVLIAIVYLVFAS
jgi:hypothetical protein